MNRYQLGDALFHLGQQLDALLRNGQAQLGEFEVDTLRSSQIALEEVALNIKAEEMLSERDIYYRLCEGWY